MMQVIFALIKKELIQAFRDTRMLIILVVAPIIQLVIFGYVATTDIKNVPIVIIDLSQSSTSRALTSSFFTSDHFVRVMPSLGWRGEPEDFLKSGKAKIVVLIPPEFSKMIERNETAEVMIVADGSDANSATITNNYVIELIQTFAQDIAQRQLNNVASGQISFMQSIPVVIPHVRIWYNPELKSSHYMVPGIICMILLIITSLLTAMAITRERELGTLEQVLVSPLKRWEFILGKTIPFVFVGFAEVMIILFLARVLFHIHVRGSLPLLFFTAIIFLFTTLGIGLFAASVSKTQIQAMLTVFPILMPTFLLSGLFFPVSSIPIMLRWIAYINPLTYFLIIVRGILLKGNGFFDIYREVIVLAIFGAFFIVFSSVRLRKRIE